MRRVSRLRVTVPGTRTRDDDDDGERNRDDRTSVSESKRRRRLAALDEAAARDAASIVDEMDGPWIDAVGPLLAAEWTRARRGVGATDDAVDAAVGAIREAAASAAGNARWGKTTRARRRGRLIRAARAFALTAMLRDALVEDQLGHHDADGVSGCVPRRRRGDGGGDGAASAPLRVRAHGDLEVREGTEVLVPGAQERGPDGHPARAVVSRGVRRRRERRVFLAVASRVKGACVSSSALLVEPIENASSRGNVGVVRAVAPLAGCRTEIDASHRKWLHARAIAAIVPPRRR